MLLIAAIAVVPVLSAWSQDGKSAGGDASVVGAAQRMAVRRQQEVEQIQQILRKAESDRSQGNYALAYSGYSTALKSTPKIPATTDLRRTIFARYQIGAMDFARQLANGGQPNDAETVLKRVLSDAREMEMDPSAIREDFRTLLGQVRDKERYGDARTPKHIANVEQVAKLLKEAKGALDLGDLDRARQTYVAVLTVDAYNESAARGLEMVSQMMYEYEKTAHEHTRALFAREIEQEWEMPIPPHIKGVDLSYLENNQESVALSSVGDIKRKIASITIPSIQFDGAPLSSVLAFLSQKAAELDVSEPDPAKRGLNIVIDPHTAAAADDLGSHPVTIKLSNVPLDDVLRYVTAQAKLKYRVDPYAVTVVPLSAADDTVLIPETFTVPPGFITNSPGGAPAAVIDPFAAPAGDGGATMVKRQTAEEFLTSQGIVFPAGASASYIPSTNKLVVRNTPEALSLIRSMVAGQRSKGEKMVEVSLKMISVSKETIRENGFDSLLSPFNVDSGATTFLSGGTAGNQAGRLNDDFPFRFPNGEPVGTNSLTSGLRSGDVRTKIGIDDAIQRTTAAPASSVAPGVFGYSGVFSDPQFQTVWRALEQSKGIDRLCDTSLFVKPGQRAKLSAVREFIYPTEYDPPEVPTTAGGARTPVTPAFPNSYEMRPLGKIVEVEPLVGDDNFSVNLSVDVDMSDFIGFVNYGTPIITPEIVDFGNVIPAIVVRNDILQPVFEAVKETTNVTVWDGQTVVIGGFVGERVTDVEDRVPILGSIPGIGRLFRSSVEISNARAVMLFVSVRIVDPAGEPLNEIGSKKVASLAP